MEHLSIYSITLFFLLYFTTKTHAQPAASPAPAGPLNFTAILEKAGQFTTFMKMCENTHVAEQIDNQLNNSNNGMTVFAPTDNAFSTLPPGTLNSLTDQQKVALIQFHVLPSLVTISQFQTVSNPLRTQAGNADNGQYPLNVTTMGNQVNITTGVVNTTISNTLFSDSQLAVYQVDKVLLPLDIFRPSTPAPAPAPAKAKKKASSPSSTPSKDSSDDSAGVSLKKSTIARVFTLAVAVSFFCVGL